MTIASDLMRQHFDNIVRHQSERNAVVEFRKRVSWYAKTMHPCRMLRMEMRDIQSAADFEDVLSELGDSGYGFSSEWFEAQLEFRFPVFGRVTHGGVTLEVADVQFSGAGPDELPALRAAAEGLVGKDYVRTEIQTYATTKLLPVYLQHGYLKASIGNPEAKVAKEKPAVKPVAKKK